MGNAVPDQNK